MATNQLLNEYLRLAKIQELEEKYSMRGFDVVINGESGGFTFDIVANATKRYHVSKYIMVKTGHYSVEQIVLISSMREYVEQTLGAEFELVIAKPPRKKEIVFADFEDALDKYIKDLFVGEESSENDDVIEQLEAIRDLSHDTLIEGVDDIELDSIYFDADDIVVKGVATINVILQFKSEGEDPIKVVDSYSCSFEAHVYDIYGYDGLSIEIEEFEIELPEDETNEEED